jgi:hypothetical protein
MLTFEEREQIFQDYEPQLDRLISDMRDYIIALGITITDRSNRQRLEVGDGYYDLWWGFFFDKTWDVNGNRSFAQLRIVYSEPRTSGEPSVLRGVIYFGAGDAVNLDTKVVSGSVEWRRLSTTKVDGLTSANLTTLLVAEFESAARTLGQKL